MIGLIILLSTRRKKAFEGEVFCRYMIWYGIGRAVIEGLRADSLYLGSFRVSQLLSVCIVFLAVVVIAYKRKKLKKHLTNEEI